MSNITRFVSILSTFVSQILKDTGKTDAWHKQFSYKTPHLILIPTSTPNNGKSFDDF